MCRTDGLYPARYEKCRVLKAPSTYMSLFLWLTSLSQKGALVPSLSTLLRSPKSSGALLKPIASPGTTLMPFFLCSHP